MYRNPPSIKQITPKKKPRIQTLVKPHEGLPVMSERDWFDIHINQMDFEFLRDTWKWFQDDYFATYQRPIPFTREEILEAKLKGSKITVIYPKQTLLAITGRENN